MDANEEIKKMLTGITGLNFDEIGDEDNLVEDLGVDSLKVIEIATEMEKSFKVKVKDSHLMNIKTVADVSKVLKELLEAKIA